MRGPGLTEARVREALRAVLDPELDRPIPDLGFVGGVEVRGDEVRVELRLPTYWCAPNFSWLMAADARDAVLALPGVRAATVVLADHHAGAEISEGVTGGRSFRETFAGEATGDLDALRRRFRRKAFLARLDRLLRALGRPHPAGLRVGDLPDRPETRAYLEVRSELGLDCSAEAPVLTDPEGRPVSDPEAFLRYARAVRVSLETGAVWCRGVLRTRYGEGEEGSEP